MLKDRRVLIEQELKKVNSEAANMYLSIAVGRGDVYSKEYQELKARIADLNFDLSAINTLISQGHD